MINKHKNNWWQTLWRRLTTRKARLASKLKLNMFLIRMKYIRRSLKAIWRRNCPLKSAGKIESFMEQKLQTTDKMIIETEIYVWLLCELKLILSPQMISSFHLSLHSILFLLHQLDQLSILYALKWCVLQLLRKWTTFRNLIGLPSFYDVIIIT